MYYHYSMNVRITPRRFSGTVRVPASKSHTIRQLLIASLADGVSELFYPLDSLDTRSCLNACRTFGAEITEIRAADPDCPNPPDEKGEKLVKLVVKGNANFRDLGLGTRDKVLVRKDSLKHDNYLNSLTPSPQPLDIGNSGTTLYFAIAIAGLQSHPFTFTGDEQIKRRSAAPLLEALAGLGVQCQSNKGCAPVTVKGPWAGGKVTLPCPTSQYLSALLIAAPLAPSGTVTEIEVPLLNEKPYIEMTLSYLTAHGIPFEATGDFSRFVIPGGSSWKAFSGHVPGDFSSAAFPAAAAAISGGQVTLLGLDPCETQGDKFFFEMLRQMGCSVDWEQVSDRYVPGTFVISRSRPLKGGTFDLNNTPDLLPAAAAVAAFAHGDTALVNVAHARIKETDRIAVMAKELAKLGVACTELPDGLVIHGTGKGLLVPGPRSQVPIIEGHGDHRIVMAFAALGSSVPIEITSAESAAVTYPGFLELMGAEKSAE